jgi:histone acetyltransferase (RNA polymerase elongator complex component)
MHNDKALRGELRHVNIPIFVPHRGCPHTCVFCDQRRISGESDPQTPLKAAKTVEDSLSTLRGDCETEIAFFGGSFTAIPESEMVAYLEAVKPYLKSGRIQGIRLSTRPDAINDHVLDILERYGVTAIELGVQSMDAGVLEQSGRGHTPRDVEMACQKIGQRGIKLGIQTMVGLPGDSLDIALTTARRVISLKPQMVRIYPVLVLKGTLLERMYHQGHYAPLSLEEAVHWCAQILPLYEEAGITVLRLGLHDSETLGASVTAGPYHPAFGELVASEIFRQKIARKLVDMEVKAHEHILIRTSPHLVSKIIGQKRSNLRALQNQFGLKAIKVLGDLTKEDFSVERCSEA